MASAAATATTAGTATATGQQVSYRGVDLLVPDDWPVVDLDADPTRCVRLDVRAVYVGEPAAQQNCPAHVVGRSESIWLHESSAEALRSTTSRQTTVGSLAARTARNAVGRTKQVWFTGNGVAIDAAWGTDESAVDAILATATSGDTAPAAPTD